MHFEYFPTEIITHVFLSCETVHSALSLSSTCRRFNKIFKSSKRLSILQQAAEAQYGPLEDAVQLVTHNASQPAHLIRSVPFSLALLKQINHVGRVAEKWSDIYPFKKWKVNFQDRRLLDRDERYRLRRALYRLWLYTRAFHTSAHARDQRMNLQLVHIRAELLHNWTTEELAEIADVHAVLREVVHGNVCPSNGAIGTINFLSSDLLYVLIAVLARKFKKRFPDNEHQPLFNIHLNYPPPPFAAPMPTSQFHNPPSPNMIAAQYHDGPSHVNRYRYSKFTATPFHEPGAEGWGDSTSHYYVVEDVLKLDPEQIIWLKENAPLKGMVESYVKSLGDWFENNGETWTQTLEWVIRERGEEMDELMDAVVDGELGIALSED